MTFFNAEAQSKAFVKARYPILLFGLLLFAQGLTEPLMPQVHQWLSWSKLLPLAAALYLAASDDLPALFDTHIDEYTQQTEMLARTHAGIASMVFLIATMIAESANLWSYANAVDCVVGFYLVFYAGTVLVKMQED